MKIGGQIPWMLHLSAKRHRFIIWWENVPGNIHLDTGSSNSRRKSRRFSWRIRRVSSTTSRPISECRWSYKWFWVHVRKLHIPPSRWTKSQNFTRREKNHSTIPLKYIDVSRTTHTNLDVKQEHRIDDYWNIYGSRDLSDSWTGFTQITLLSERPPEGYMWSGRETEKTASDIQARSLMARTLNEIGKKCPVEGEAKVVTWKQKLDNARKLRDSCFIDPEDKEFKETIKNARKKLETPMAPAMPCKTSKNSQHGVTRGKSNEIKSKLACILEASESTRLRLEESLPNIMTTILQEKVTIHYNITIWYTN